MKTLVRTRWIELATCAIALLLVPAPARAADAKKANKANVANVANKACALVKPAEVAAALGDKVTLLPQAGMEGLSICYGTTPKVSVMLRIATKSEASGDAEKAGIEAERKKGAQVDVKTFGPMTCSTIVPPESLAAQGFNTTCSMTNATSVAAIEITATTKADMVSIDRLKALADKMAGRF